MNFGFGYPGMFGMVNSREQTLAHLKAIRSHKQSVANAKAKVERLEKEEHALINERDGYHLKNTHDTSHASRVQAQITQSVKDIWKTMRKAEVWANVVSALITLVAITFVALLFCTHFTYLSQEIASNRLDLFIILLIVNGLLGLHIYFLITFIITNISIARTYDRYKPHDSVFRVFCKVGSFVVIPLTVNFVMFWLLTETTFVNAINPLLIQIPVWSCVLVVRMVFMIVNKCVYRKCDRRERDYKWKMNKELNLATETDSQEQAAYAKENEAWLAKRKSSYAPKIAAKQKEIAEAKAALRQHPGCAVYQLYPFLENDSIDYISALIDLVEGGRADTVKEAVNLQSQIVDKRISDYEARQERLARQKAADAQAAALLSAEQERARQAKRAADELEKIRRGETI